MQADFSIECGADDECLEIPWASEDGTLCYVDLKQNPALMENLEEARRFPELAEFLRNANSRTSAFQTAKCDAGFTRELTLEDEIFETTGKFWCYIDLFFTTPEKRASFEKNKSVAESLEARLEQEPDTPAAVEFLVRRCYFHGEIPTDGFYITCYVFGYSDGEEEARQFWGTALRLLEGSLGKVSAEMWGIRHDSGRTKPT